jgi:elongation factor P
MPKASDLRRGQIIELDGEPWHVRQVDARSPSSRGAATLYKVKLGALRREQKRDESFKGDDFVAEADCQRVSVSFSYRDGADCVFMNNDDFSQYSLSSDALAEQAPYLQEGLDGIYALLLDGDIAGVELPQFVELEIVETDPSIRGASAAGRTKPATFATGLVLQVPEYLSVGDVVRINTQTGKFASRA